LGTDASLGGFTNRKTAVTRIWKAAQSLASRANAPKAAGSREWASRKPKSHPGRDGSKKDAVIKLLRRAKGATLSELVSATGWQAHSMRGFISGTLGKRLKLKVPGSRPALLASKASLRNSSSCRQVVGEVVGFDSEIKPAVATYN
jgi:hypothetical protein